MKSEEMFKGFTVGAGKARFDGHIEIGGGASDCKVSGRDTNGALCVFEFSGTDHFCGPRHSHHDQDEWIYVLEGEFEFEVGPEQFRLRAGESIFMPRKTPHCWASVSDKPGKILNAYQPAGKMEEFFRAVTKYGDPPAPQVHEVLSLDEFDQLFEEHGMSLLGPPMLGVWEVSKDPTVAPAGRLIEPGRK